MHHTSPSVRLWAVLFLLAACCSFTTQAQPATTTQDDYLSWSAKHATRVGRKWRVAGRIGFNLKFSFSQEDAYFYELRGTLMSPEAIRAAARLEQLQRHLSDAETRALVAEAEKIDGLVVYIEINPREGSGIIPLDWRSALQPKGAPEGSPLAITGTSMPELREVKALKRVGRRDYAYDVFWVVFPMRDRQGKVIWETPPDEIELVVGIHDKQGRVTWRVNDSLRQRLIELNH
jgi:hypothetical protein